MSERRHESPSPSRTPMPPPTADRPRIVLAWWGSIPGQHATIGDGLALRAVAAWAAQHGLAPVVAATLDSTTTPIPSVNWRQTDPEDVAAFCFVCGPLLATETLLEMMSHFKKRPRLALGVSVLHPSWFTPFDRIMVRDSDTDIGFDLAVAGVNDLATLFPRAYAATGAAGDGLHIGICLRGPQKEYGGLAQCRHEAVVQAIAALEKTLAGEWHAIDTVYRPKGNPPAKIIADFRRSDLVITTRMHGALLSLACGRPVVAIDQIVGGRKVARLMKKIEFPFLLSGEDLTPGLLAETVGRALAAPSDLWSDLRRRMIAEADAALERAGEMILSSIAEA